MTTRHHIIIAIGTNAGKEKACEACKMLLGRFSDATFSKVIATAPLGCNFQSTQFHNAICTCTTTMDATALIALLKAMERSAGDTSVLRQNGTVVLDLDLLKFDDTRHHAADWNRSYIKELMADILIHNKQIQHT